MDIKDQTKQYAAMLANAQKAAERASKRKGELVRHHLHPALVVSNFLLHRQPPAAGSENQFTLFTTQVPAPYLPCTVPVSELRPIMISDMRLETHHRGCKATFRVITPPSRIVALLVVIEDEKGTAVPLQIYHQPKQSVVPAEEVLRTGICIVKEPFFKCSMDGSYTVRVDHVSDIVWLEKDDDRVPQKWRTSAVTLSAGDSARTRQQGNEAVKHEKWAEAERLYSAAIRAAGTPQEEQLAYLNRSFANLRLGRPEKAMLDATRGSGVDPPFEKALFREARSLYELGQFQSSLDKLQTLLASHPENAAATSELERTKARLIEQVSGNYDFRHMYRQARKTPPLIDCATFSTPVEVREAPGKGRGLFTTMSVSAGQLVLCEKAFGYSYAEEGTPGFTALMNISTKKATVGGQADLWTQIVQKLYHRHGQSHEFWDLYCGDYGPVPASEVDGIPVVDAFQVEKIIAMNAFGAPRTSRETFVDFHNGESKDQEKDAHGTTGIWLLASRINHSCVGNCRRTFIGDMQIVRATRDIPAGTELQFTYRPAKAMESYEEVQEGLKHWGFLCECELCRERKTTPRTILKERAALRKLFGKAITGPGPTKITKSSAILEKMEKTYSTTNSSPIRMELWDPYLAVGGHLLAAHRSAEAVKMIVKGFEAMGYSISIQIPTKKQRESRLEVERWGIVNELIPWVFVRLFDACSAVAPELCGHAKHYAEISYTMVVGEKETMGESFPEFG